MPSGSTRTISYAYDGLSRLVGAVESGATTNSYAYSYDLAGNRTGATANGVTTTRAYNAANQVVGFSYDVAGNLLSDGATAYTYDALGRTTSQGGVSYAYNGDGVLVQAGATHYTQDLASPLSQILNDGSANYVYGLDRLTSSAGTWYLGDALGSVRQTLDASGAVTAAMSYDPWGQPQGSSIAPFGFTGELQDATSGLVNLRARWYDPSSGIFTAPLWRTQDSNDFVPLSHHVYAYGLGDPILYSDPYGTCSGPGCSTGTGSDFLYGFFAQWAYVNSMGTARDLAPLDCDNFAMQFGRHLGNAAGLLQGIAEGTTGSGMLGGGVVACLTTGVGCAATPLATAGGVALVGHGSAIGAAATAQELLLATRVLMSTTGGSSDSSASTGWNGRWPRTQEEFESLARDPAHGNKITPKGIDEREVVLNLEESGKLLNGPARRDPTGAAEFIDRQRVAWDIKQFNSNYPPRRGGFELQTALRQIDNELHTANENVIVDTRNMSANHIQDLQAAINAKGWSGRIIWYP